MPQYVHIYAHGELISPLVTVLAVKNYQRGAVSKKNNKLSLKYSGINLENYKGYTIVEREKVNCILILRIVTDSVKLRTNDTKNINVDNTNL